MERNAEAGPAPFLKYRLERLRIEGVPLQGIARKYGTPCYVYSAWSIGERILSIQEAFAPLSPRICYSVKANSNLALLRIMRERGLGADVVSEGELRRALIAGFPPSSIVFAGVGKTEAEIELGVRKKLLCFNVENTGELDTIERLGRRWRRKVNCALRINPDVDVDTHHYVKTAKKETKFGIDLKTARTIIRRRTGYRWARICGIHFHLGSQIKEPSGYVEALKRTAAFCTGLNFSPEILDIGGGFGIVYRPGEHAESIAAFGSAIGGGLKRFRARTLILEPGRFIIGDAGVLLCSVLYVKEHGDKRFIVVDAAMNDLIRPAFYGSYHHILPVRRRAGGAMIADVVGPVCETGDYLARERELPHRLKRGDLLAIAGAGAYSFSMSSNYNSRRRACEILVEGDRERLIRKRESFEDLWRHEIL